MKFFHKIFLIFIILLSFFLRFYKLGENPPSLSWDEASLGYNAYSIFKTGADEYGIKFPLAIRSFGDFKPPLYTYLTIPFVAAFGLNEFSVRLPSAIAGTLTVVLTFFLVRKLFSVLEIALLVSLFMAISPWHLQFSRAAFEANLGLFFFIGGALFFLKGLEKGRYFLFSSLFFVCSFYAYHSPRLVVPLFLLGLIFYYREEILKQKKWFILSFFIGFIFLLPLTVLLFGEGKARFTSVTILKPEQTLDRSIQQLDYDLKRNDFFGRFIHNRRAIYFLAGLGGYLDHFNFDFLFLKGDPPGRHHPVDFGMLYLWDFPFILAGVYFLIKKKEKANFPIFWWFLVAPAASAITTGTPHAVRSLLYLPTYQIFSAYGLWQIFLIIKEKLSRQKTILIFFLILIFLFLNFIYYLHMYYIHTPIEVSSEWQYGYKQVVEEVGKLEKDYQKIIVSYRYDQPYIYFLFYQKIDPFWYQKQAPKGEIERFFRSFGKYEFRHINWEKDKNLKDTLLVGTPQEIPQEAPGKLKEIKFLNGQTAFIILGL